MTRVLNRIFSFLKYILFLGAFGACLYIMLNMNQRLSKSIFESLQVFLPYIILLFLFLFNLLFHHENINQNLFFHLSCCLVFALILFVSYRSIADDFLIVKASFVSGINYNYYADMIAPFQVMLYGLCLADACLILAYEKPIFKKMEEKKPVASSKTKPQLNKKKH